MKDSILYSVVFGILMSLPVVSFAQPIKFSTTGPEIYKVSFKRSAHYYIHDHMLFLAPLLQDPHSADKPYIKEDWGNLN